MKDLFRKANAVMLGTGFAPYTINIYSDHVYLQGKFNPDVVRKLKKWEMTKDDNGYIHFIKSNVKIIMT